MRNEAPRKTPPTGARRIAVITVGRSDFSILRPLCELLNNAPDFEVELWVGGAHFDPLSGMTIREIENSSLPITARVHASDYDRDPGAIVRNIASQVSGFGGAALDAIARGNRPDLVLILGDRFEAIAAALAMIPFGIPIGHLSGGSITKGAMDDMFRHSLTKLAALHFCDLPDFAKRIQQMGEEPWRIFVTGALGLDSIAARTPKPFSSLVEEFGLKNLRPGYLLATLHPETMALGRTSPMAQAMVDAVKRSGRQVVYTYPNADPTSDQIVEIIEQAATRTPGHFVVKSFGEGWFHTAMAYAGMCIGNSSAGIYEAASFRLPVVNIGKRQEGRFHGNNVVHCGDNSSEILEAISRADAIRSTLVDMVNPYGDGCGAARVLAVLRTIDWEKLRTPKHFMNPDPNFEGQRVETVCS